MTTLNIIRELITENMQELKEMVQDKEGRKALVALLIVTALMITAIAMLGGEPL